ncbi:hypothetical protein MPLA_1440014 [Mesorhizobium sp. ORS 3359]|nr:hypothetical protein MPLA_1440014 [Mesorhizobium sp. ORS 3359]
MRSKRAGRHGSTQALRTDPVAMLSGGRRITIRASRTGQSGLPKARKTAPTRPATSNAANKFAIILPGCTASNSKSVPEGKECPSHRRNDGHSVVNRR